MNTDHTPHIVSHHPDSLPTTPLSSEEASRLLAPVDGRLSSLANNLLVAFLNPTIDLPALATTHRLTIEGLLAWWRSPEVKRAMDDLEALAAQRTRLTAAHDAPRMALRLAQLAEDAKPETARRAAVNVLHLAGCTPTAPARVPRPRAAGPCPDSPKTRTAPTPPPPRATDSPRVGAPHAPRLRPARLLAHAGTSSPLS